MDREQYFASKLEAGQYLTQVELEELIYSFDIDNVIVEDVDENFKFIPVAFDGKYYLVPCNYCVKGGFIHQPLVARQDWKNHWTPVEHVDEVLPRWQQEIKELGLDNDVVIESCDEYSINPELIKTLHDRQDRIKELFGSVRDVSAEELEAVSRYIDAIADTE